MRLVSWLDGGLLVVFRLQLLKTKTAKRCKRRFLHRATYYANFPRTDQTITVASASTLYLVAAGLFGRFV